MKKIRIGIDIDNVIADSYPAFLARFNEFFKKKIRYEEVSDFYFLEKSAGVDHDRAKDFIHQLVVDEEFQLQIPPYEKVLPVISSWKKKGHGVHYITSRPHTAKGLTHKWLTKHGFLMPGTTLDLFDSATHFDIHRQKIMEYKKAVAQKHGAQLFIEDSKEIAETMEIQVLLVDKPWNQGKLPKNVKRVKNWEEIDWLTRNLTNPSGRCNL